MILAFGMFSVPGKAQFAPPSAVAPQLAITKSNQEITVSWLISPFDLFLESIDSLSATGAWNAVSAPVSAVEDRNMVVLPATDSNQFFRLGSRFPYGSLLPVFQFGIFYAVDLEIHPGQNTVMTGPVHCNSNIYAAPNGSLTFQQRVTAAGTIHHARSPFDSTPASTNVPVYQGGRRAGVTPLTFSIHTNPTATMLRELVKPPPIGELPAWGLGRERFYNKADLIITVTGTTNLVTSGIVNNQGTVINMSSLPAPQKWLNTSKTLYNKRENKTVRQIEIDIARLVTWNTSVNNTLPLRYNGAKDVTIIYIDDQRALPASQESGVLIRNGALLPAYGLTIATPKPIYVAGNYNVQSSATNSPVLGSTNTTQTKPAALIGDAITILSAAWQTTNPDYGTSTFATRRATDTTVNAALVAGIVQTTATNGYSGGVDNFIRFLEDWSAKTLTFNGSMVALYDSIYATGLWVGSGPVIGIYNPPIRQYSFDANFLDPAKLPPGTPIVGVLPPAN